MRISDWSSDVCSSDLDVTGQSYAAHVTAILRGAGLHDARVDDGEAVIAGRAEPYTRDGGVIRHATPMSSSISSVAAGGVLMSARDVPAWAAALWSGKLLSPASLALMQTPVTLTSGRSCFYNMGWFIDALPNGAAYLWHTGSVSRSEEHTSELQSLMSISYAVFC